MRSSIVCTVHEILIGRSNEEDEMRGAHSVYGGDDKCVQNFGCQA
jgi:hypothetical protein